MIKITDQEFRVMMTYIRDKYGINLENKQYLIESKLWIELAKCKVDNYTKYMEIVKSDPTGVIEQRMIDLLTTNYTFFCREGQHFDFIKTQIAPKINNTFNIFCAGCATGQECYTLAMSLLDCRTEGILKNDFKIVGADLSETALAAARKAKYSGADYARIPAAWKRNYCTAMKGGSFEINNGVKTTVTFRQQNLLDKFPLAEKYDLIFCRNVLIYFRLQDRIKIVNQLADSLVSGGYLFTGHTEIVTGCEDVLEYIQPAVYRRKEVCHD